VGAEPAAVGVPASTAGPAGASTGRAARVRTDP
jgi:hypothetical protein